MERSYHLWDATVVCEDSAIHYNSSECDIQNIDITISGPTTDSQYGESVFVLENGQGLQLYHRSTKSLYTNIPL